ncbi:MAG: cysteine desulfurase NifS [Rhodopila sp.]|jgi:cysteine desulfurase
MRAVYLDNNATTPVHPEVLAAMLPYFTDQFGNASSSHAFGTTVSPAIREARRAVRDLLGAALDQEIIFTCGGTEADNTAILSALENHDGRDEVIVSAVEHPALLTLCAHLERSRGVRVHRTPVDAKGRLDMDAYRAALGPRTAIVSIMWANNETGTLFPVADLAALAREAGALFHTDAVQAAGKLPIDLKTTPIDMLSISAHKLHGPKGVGALYVRKDTPFHPLIRGGQQERGRRGGTENVPGIVGLGRAAHLAGLHIDDDLILVNDLRDRLEQGILQRIPDCAVVGDPVHRLANTSNIAFNRAEAEPILMHLDREGIAVSSGSACTSGSAEPSHVLRAMRVPFTAAHGAIRFSFSRLNGSDDVDRVLDVLPRIVERARAVSLFGDRSTSPNVLQSHIN